MTRAKLNERYKRSTRFSRESLYTPFQTLLNGVREALVRGPLRGEKRITRLSRATLDQRAGSPGISAYDLHRSTSAHQRRI
jgi:hypothetical protein